MSYYNHATKIPTKSGLIDVCNLKLTVQIAGMTNPYYFLINIDYQLFQTFSHGVRAFFVALLALLKLRLRMLITSGQPFE